MRGVKLDLEGHEIAALDRAVALRGKRIIEIGCGDGRLTRALAERAREVGAIDPNPRDIRAARQSTPKHLKRRVRFQVATAEDLPFRDGEFAVAVFSWSL